MLEAPISFKTRIDWINTEANEAKVSLLIGEHVVYSKTVVVLGPRDVEEAADQLVKDFAYRLLTKLND